MKKIEFELSEKSIDAFAKDLKHFKHDFSRMATEFTNQGLKHLEKVSMDNVWLTIGKTGYPITGELANSFITQKVDKHTGVLINTHPNAAAVEFGTGLLGAESPHPVSGKANYKYNINHHIDGWWYIDEKQNEWFYTYGQIAHRFMYDAIIEFKTSGIIEELGEKAFNKIFGG